VKKGTGVPSSFSTKLTVWEAEDEQASRLLLYYK
jgi:hypothetical protein